MNNYKITVDAYLIVTLLMGFMIGCTYNDSSTDALLVHTEHQQAIASSTRRTLETEWDQIEEEVYFSVIYTGNLDEILSNSSSHLGALIQAHEFQLTAPFEIDETMKGIILRRFEALKDPVTIAKEISLCEEVLMVEVKNRTQEVL